MRPRGSRNKRGPALRGRCPRCGKDVALYLNYEETSYDNTGVHLCVIGQGEIVCMVTGNIKTRERASERRR